MKRTVYTFFIMFILLIGSISSVYSLETYVGVEIQDLKDDPNASCVGEFNSTVDPNQQGRIRAISSIVGDEYTEEYPIYFELENVDSGDMVWSGNSTEDTDYGIGDTMYIPETLDLTIGTNYKLFFDIDAYRLYLPLVNHEEFESTIDNNYWTTLRENDWHENEYYTSSDSNECAIEPSTGKIDFHDGDIVFVSNSRNLNYSCIYDSESNNCIEEGLMGIPIYSTYGDEIGFNMKNISPIELQEPDVGNFNIGFTFN